MKNGTITSESRMYFIVIRHEAWKTIQVKGYGYIIKRNSTFLSFFIRYLLRLSKTGVATCRTMSAKAELLKNASHKNVSASSLYKHLDIY